MKYSELIDIGDAKERFLENETLYKKFLFRFPGENRYEKLEECVNAGDARQAFEVAHALKGVAANLSLTMYYRTISVITEILRAEKLPSPEQMAELEEIGRETENAINEIAEKNERLF